MRFPFHPKKVLYMSYLAVGFTAFANAVHADSEAPLKQFDTVVVTASGFEQLVENAPASISVISREDLAKKAYRDVTDALRDVPGVVITGGGSSSDISIRGMAPGYTLILVDGKRMSSRETRPNSDGPGIEQGWLPPIEAIERIEVVRGPMSSLYGSEAMGGVINIITRKISPEWTGSLRTEGTLQQHSDSGNIYQGGFYLSGPIKEDLLGVQVSGQKVRRQEDRIVNGFNKQDTGSGNIKLTLTPNENHDLTAEAGRTVQKRIATPGRSMAKQNCNARGCRTNTASESSYTRDYYSLTHSGRYGALSSDSYIQQEETTNPGRQMKLKNQELSTQWNLGLDTHHMTVGMQYSREKLGDQGNQLNPSINSIKRSQWALFAEDEWQLHPSFALTGGVRLTHDQKYGNHITPRLYGLWNVTDELTIKGGISTGFKAPRLRQTVGDWGQITGGPTAAVPSVILGNPDLKPEKSVSQELGFVWDNRENLNVGLMLFNTDFKDKISEVIVCDGPNGQYNCPHGGSSFKSIRKQVNVDKANMRGVEAVATWELTENLSWASNYTFTHSKQKSGPYAGKPLNKLPKHMFNSTLDWQYNEALNLWTRLNYRGKSSEYLSRTSMRQSTPAFTFVDLGMNYKLNKKVNFGVGIYNIFDKRVDYETYDAVYDGRRFWAQVTVGF